MRRFNPWWGCTRVSPACEHCYAETWANRYGVGWGNQSPRRFFGEKHWNEPLKWNRKAKAEGIVRRVFCASMADVFEILPDTHPDKGQQANERIRLLDLIEKTSHLDWLLLTKRPENVLGLLDRWEEEYPENVWIGTTVEDQRRAEERLPYLLQIPARVRFVSCEPLLGPLDLRRWINAKWTQTGIDWVIAGGESGPSARPTHPDWFRSLRDQCRGASPCPVAFHFKQFGDWAPVPTAGDDPHPRGLSVQALADGTITDAGWNGGAGTHLRGAQPMWRLGKKEAGRTLDGRTWDEFPQVNWP